MLRKTIAFGVVLMLVGCSAPNDIPTITPATPPTTTIASTPQPISTPKPAPTPRLTPLPAQKSVYEYSGSDGKCGILSGDGRVVVPVEHDMAYVICDINTLKPCALAVGDYFYTQNERQMRTALFSLQGEQLTSFMYAHISGYTSGGLCGAVYFDRKKHAILKLDGKELPVKIGGESDICLLSSCVMVYDYNTSEVTFYNEEGKVQSFPALRQSCYGGTDMVSVFNGTKWGVVSPSGVLVPYQYDYICIMDGAAALDTQEDGEFVRSRLIGPDGKILLETTLGSIIEYRGGYCVINSSDSVNGQYQHILNTAGNVVGGKYQNISLLNPNKGLLAMTWDENGEQHVLRADGTEITSLPMERFGGLIPYTEMLLAQFGEIFGIYNSAGQRALDLSSYMDAYILYPSHYIFAYRPNYLGDIWDAYGNLLITNVQEPQALDETRLMCRRGFERGLMDFHGNYVYRESVFTKWED